MGGARVEGVFYMMDYSRIMFNQRCRKGATPLSSGQRTYSQRQLQIRTRAGRDQAE